MSAPGLGRPLGKPTSDCAPNDQCGAVWSHRANQTTQLENGNRNEEADLQGKELVGFAPGGLKGADGEEEGGAVPSHLVQAVKLVGDLGNGGRDDGHVKCDEEDGEDESDDNHSKLEGLGVIGCCYP